MVTCNDELKSDINNIKETLKSDSRNFVFEYSGPEGCKFIDGSTFLTSIVRFFGFIILGLGVVMTFAGSKFIFYVLRAVIFIVVAGLSSGICYGVGFIEPTGGAKTWIGIIICLAAGIAVAYCCGNLAEKFMVPLMAMLIAGGVTRKALSIVHIQGLVSFILIIAAMYAAFKYAEKFNKYIKSIGTAIIGAMLLVNAIGMVATYKDTSTT